MNSIEKTWLMMGILVAFAAAVAFAFGKLAGYGASFVGPALVISGVFAFFSYYFSDRMVLAISGAKPVSREQDPKLYEVVSDVAQKANLPMPKVYAIADASPNAFATGRDPKHAAIAITYGLREKLNRSEMEGVIGHELSHVKNFDTRLMAVTAILVGFVSMLADWFMRSLWFQDNRDNRGNGSEMIFVIIGLVLAILSPIVATIIQLAISRRREFAADASGAKITSDPEGLASALEKISADRTPAKFANNATAHLFIVNPFKGKSVTSFLAGLFDTHPPIAERIKLLRQM
ncbi:M48 family metalloprotease [Patescibacteria group bacterium]|nr:M48 family metalloprotease [Patescibacteria group bacterium]